MLTTLLGKVDVYYVFENSPNSQLLILTRIIIEIFGRQANIYLFEL